MSKKVKNSIGILLMILLCSVLCSPLWASGSKIVPEKEPPEVIYVPGWMSGQKNNYDDEKNLIGKILAPVSIKVFLWEESGILYFPACAKAADEKVVPRLAKYILDNCKLSNLVLVGHSLGGRIVVKTMAELAKQNKKIRYGVFLGSAISFEDDCIRKALDAAGEECINIFSTQDKALKEWYGSYNNQNALGAYGYKFNAPNLRQFKSAVNDHAALSYLEYLAKVKRGELPEFKRQPEVKVLYPCDPVKLPGNNYNVVSRAGQWRLIKGKRNDYYVVDPDDRIRARGNESRMRKSFNAVKQQLKL